TSIASSASMSSMVGYDFGSPSCSAATADRSGDDEVRPTRVALAARAARLCVSAMKPPPMKPTPSEGMARVTSVVMPSILTHNAHLLPANTQKSFAFRSIVVLSLGLVGVVY